MKTMQLFFCVTMCFVSSLIHAGEAEEKKSKKQKMHRVTIHHRPTRERLMEVNAELNAFCTALMAERDQTISVFNELLKKHNELQQDHQELQQKSEQYKALNKELTLKNAAQIKKMAEISIHYQRGSVKRTQNLRNGEHHTSIFNIRIETPEL